MARSVHAINAPRYSIIEHDSELSPIPRTELIWSAVWGSESGKLPAATQNVALRNFSYFGNQARVNRRNLRGFRPPVIASRHSRRTGFFSNSIRSGINDRWRIGFRLGMKEDRSHVAIRATTTAKGDGVDPGIGAICLKIP